MPSLSAYQLTGFSLTLDVGYLLMAPLLDIGHGISPSQPQLLTLDMGYPLCPATLDSSTAQSPLTAVAGTLKKKIMMIPLCYVLFTTMKINQ